MLEMVVGAVIMLFGVLVGFAIATSAVASHMSRSMKDALPLLERELRRTGS